MSCRDKIHLTSNIVDIDNNFHVIVANYLQLSSRTLAYKWEEG